MHALNDSTQKMGFDGVVHQCCVLIGWFSWRCLERFSAVNNGGNYRKMQHLQLYWSFGLDSFTHINV
jgi:methylaspartate ammonia-lyase